MWYIQHGAQKGFKFNCITILKTYFYDSIQNESKLECELAEDSNLSFFSNFNANAERSFSALGRTKYY
ncbi:hypothetical protein BpHYR1_051909 [Brachionus plicatilis]|uniref:Uncharacterized protein n=1 Tax=Brachionus plicatilis TaxID=10195 RepID=A0A3M7RLM8_BRAPC|nr:hypothetical protein BpHYR1_051909 [Brachionus plicatilis]